MDWFEWIFIFGFLSTGALITCVILLSVIVHRLRPIQPQFAYDPYRSGVAPSEGFTRHDL